MSTDCNLRGAYGEAYVQALAYAAGLTASKDTPDISGIDLKIGHPGELDEIRFPCIEVQVKTWDGGDLDTELWTYRGLTVPQFNKLAGGRTMIPRYLVVLLVPKSTPLVELRDDGLLLRHQARYVDLSGEPKRSGDTANKVSVQLPHTQLLDIDSIRQLVHPSLVEAAA